MNKSVSQFTRNRIAEATYTPCPAVTDVLLDLALRALPLSTTQSSGVHAIRMIMEARRSRVRGGHEYAQRRLMESIAASTSTFSALYHEAHAAWMRQEGASVDYPYICEPSGPARKDAPCLPMPWDHTVPPPPPLPPPLP